MNIEQANSRMISLLFQAKDICLSDDVKSDVSMHNINASINDVLCVIDTDGSAALPIPPKFNIDELKLISSLLNKYNGKKIYIEREEMAGNNALNKIVSYLSKINEMGGV